MIVDSLVMSLVMADWIQPEGIFHKKSGINLKKAIELFNKLDEYYKTEINKEDLVKNLFFWSLHFKDETTLAKFTKMVN